jgi:hypothetical protein
MMRNCEGRADLRGPYFDWAPELRQCPWTKIEQEAWELVGLWKEWSTIGSLPFPGELDDQPQWVAELLTIAETHHQGSQEHARARREHVTFERMLAAARAAGQR